MVAAIDAVFVGVAGGLALVGAVATVAERTFAVMFPDPAALVVDVSGFGAGLLGSGAVEAAVEVVGALLLSACPLAGVVVTAEAVTAGLPGAAGLALVVTVSGLFPADAVDGVLAVTTIVDAAGGVRLLPTCAFCTVTEFAEAALTGPAVAVCAVGTLPEPGVPMPGNTVPCCRLPVFGCVAEGEPGVGVALAWVLAAGCVSGKLIGGSFGGTGIGADAVVLVVSGMGSDCLRWNTPMRGAEAAGTGPLRRAAEVSLPCTRRVMVLPSALNV